jgi:hypothetical protein
MTDTYGEPVESTEPVEPTEPDAGNSTVDTEAETDPDQ